MSEENEIILRDRAMKIAKKKDNNKQLESEYLSIVEFLLIPERYAFEGKFVTEVLTLKEITPIPGTPSFVMGVINLRGRILSIINLKAVFNLKERGLTELNKVIILKKDNIEFGIVADSIIGTKKIAIEKFSSPPMSIDNIGAKYINGVSPDGLIMLNAEAILSSKEIIFSNK